MAALEDDERGDVHEDHRHRRNLSEQAIRNELRLLNLISYLTRRARGWKLGQCKRGTKAPQAAGKDTYELEGFIELRPLRPTGWQRCGESTA